MFWCQNARFSPGEDPFLVPKVYIINEITKYIQIKVLYLYINCLIYMADRRIGILRQYYKGWLRHRKTDLCEPHPPPPIPVLFNIILIIGQIHHHTKVGLCDWASMRYTDSHHSVDGVWLRMTGGWEPLPCVRVRAHTWALFFIVINMQIT